jgi:hypothetical protein
MGDGKSFRRRLIHGYQQIAAAGGDLPSIHRHNHQRKRAHNSLIPFESRLIDTDYFSRLWIGEASLLGSE